MTTKKKKFATTLLTTALFTYGFSLEADAVLHTEEQTPTEVCVATTETEPQDLAQTKHKTGHPSPQKATVSPSELPEEETPLEESEEPTQGEQAHFEDSEEQLPDSETQDLAQTKRKTGQPSPENTPTSHGKPQQEQPHQVSEEPNTAEQDTHPPEDILQKVLNNTYEFNGDEVI